MHVICIGKSTPLIPIVTVVVMVIAITMNTTRMGSKELIFLA